MNYNDIFRSAFSSVSSGTGNADFIKSIEEKATHDEGRPQISGNAVRLTEIKVEPPVKKPFSKKKAFHPCG